MKQYSKSMFFIKHAIWTTVITMIYRYSAFFEPLFRSDFKNDLFLIWTAVICCLLGMAVTWRRRSDFALFINVLMPSMIWIAISRFNTIPFLVVCIALGAPTIYFVLNRINRKKTNTRRRYLIREQAILFLRMVRRGVAGGLAIIIIFLGGRAWFGTPAASTESNQVREPVLLEDEENLKVLSNLTDDKWPSLSSREKLAVLQKAVDIATYSFGVPELQVVSGRIDDHEDEDYTYHTLAVYSHYKNSITINKEHLKNDTGKECLVSVLHEVRHGYQHQLVTIYDSVPEEQHDSLLFRRNEDIAAFKRDFDHYENGNKDFRKYYTQTVEEDARDWSRIAAMIYFQQIREYLKQQMGV